MNVEPHTITYDFGKLLSVHQHEYECDENENNMISGIHLKFEDGEVFHDALIDTSEINCVSKFKEQYGTSKNISDDDPWIKVIGKSVRWFWKPKNQQGYSDSVQYSFANPNDSEETIVQLLVVASEIYTYELKAITKKST